MKEEYFWSIVIEQDLVQAGIWTVRDGNVAIISTSSALSWETDEDLVKKADEVLSLAVADFPEDAKEPSKTVFGVPASWVEDGKIKKPHLEKIRLISQKLSLSPTGFVVLPEAIAHSVKIREGSPLSGVVMGVGAGSLDITVFRLGNIVGTVNVGRSASVEEDVVEGLSRFAGTQNIPTRWLLYDGKEVDLEEVKQSLMKADWKDIGEGLKFLHTPQVEIVDLAKKAEAVSIAGASEMGEVTGVEGVETVVSGSSEDASNISETKDLSPEDLGFVIDQDIDASSDQENVPAQEFARKKFKLPAIAGIFSKVKFKMPRLGGQKKLKYLLFLVPLILVIGLIVAWLYLPRAEITIYISPKNLQESEVVVLDENIDTADAGKFIFPARSIEVEVTSEKSTTTTGTKLVGERASGSVTIRNGTAAEEEFESGTVLASGSLEFVIDEDVVVPEAQSPTTPGSVTVSASAADIGSDYNLAVDTSMSVANFPKSEIDAVVSEEFTGGSSEEIQAVSESDLADLEDSLEGDLESKALNELQGQVGAARFVRDATRFSVVDTSFSARAGDEANSVSLTMTMSATGLVLPEEQIAELSELILREQVPEGFSLRPEQVKAEFELADEIDDGVWEFDVSLSANLLPSVDIDKIKREIAGKQKDAVMEYLPTAIPGHVRSEIKVSPTFPGFLGNIPRIVGSISVEVASE